MNLFVTMCCMVLLLATKQDMTDNEFMHSIIHDVMTREYPEILKYARNVTTSCEYAEELKIIVQEALDAFFIITRMDKKSKIRRFIINFDYDYTSYTFSGYKTRFIIKFISKVLAIKCNIEETVISSDSFVTSRLYTKGCSFVSNKQFNKFYNDNKEFVVSKILENLTIFICDVTGVLNLSKDGNNLKSIKQQLTAINAIENFSEYMRKNKINAARLLINPNNDGSARLFLVNKDYLPSLDPGPVYNEPKLTKINTELYKPLVKKVTVLKKHSENLTVKETGLFTKVLSYYTEIIRCSLILKLDLLDIDKFNVTCQVLTKEEFIEEISGTYKNVSNLTEYI